MRRLWSALGVAGVLAASGPVAAAAACPAFDHAHGAWTALLGRYVSAGQVDYAAWKREGVPALEAYLGTLSAACTARYDGWTRAQRLAFWLNVYNAAAVKLVLDRHPLRSLRDVGWLPNAAFRLAVIPMDGLERGTMSLDDVEHRTIRADPALRDPRVHFALVCAARSCPPLRAEAYRAADLDVQLGEQGRTFLRDASKNRWDPATRTLHLSSIFKWFREDFEAVAPDLPAFVAPYLDGEAATAVRAGDVRVEFLPYDWALNER
jgi:hypothetical protein